MWIEYKAILKECEAIFYNAIGKCRVVINAPPRIQVKQEKPESSCIEMSLDSDTTATDALEYSALPVPFPSELPETSQENSMQIQSELPENSQENLIHIPLEPPENLLQTPPATPPIKDAVIPKPTTEYVEQLKDHEPENVTKKIPQQRRGRSLSRSGSQLQDINDNVVSKRARRSRRETSVPSKWAEYENSGKVRRTRAFSVQSQNASTPTNKRGRSPRENSTPPNKKARIESPKMSDIEIYARYGIKPCIIRIEKLPITPPKNVKTVAKKRVRQLKVKVPAVAKKVKSPKIKEQPKTKKTRSAAFPLPVGFKEEGDDIPAVIIRELTNGMLKNTARSEGLIITEDLPPSLVISEGF